MKTCVRRHLVLGLVAVLVLGTGASALLLTDRNAVRRASYERIQVGMTRAEVEQLLGPAEFHYESFYDAQLFYDAYPGRPLPRDTIELNWGRSPGFYIRLQVDRQNETVIQKSCGEGTLGERVNDEIYWLLRCLR